MKTTIDLPEEVVHQIKLRAVIERRTVKQLVEELLRKGLNLANPASGETARSDRVLLGGDFKAFVVAGLELKLVA